MNKSNLLIASLVSSFVFLAATKKTVPRIIFIHQPLVIAAQKSEPPRVAFDLVMSDAIQNEWSSLSGSGFNNLNISNPHTAKRLVLTPMLISRNLEAKPVQPRFVASVDRRQNYRPEPVVERATAQELAENLSPRQAQRLIMAQQKNNVLDEDWTIPTWTEYVQEELSKQGVHIAELANANRQNSELVNTKPDTIKPSYVIEGPIRLVGGLPSLGTRLNIRRVAENKSKEIGNITSDGGNYKIQVDELKGYIVAELSDPVLGVIGEGRLRLKSDHSQQNIIQGQTLYIEKAHSSIAARGPLFDATAGGADSLMQAKSIASNDKNSKLQKLSMYVPSFDLHTETDGLGYARIDRVHKNSWLMMRTEGKDTFPAIHLTESAAEMNLPTFRKTMLQALLDIAQDHLGLKLDSKPSIVWGRTVANGAGAESIKIHVESDPSAKVIYFNEFMLPDFQRESSSSSGYFAILGLQSGWHSLVGYNGEQIHSYANVITDEGAVSPVVMNRPTQKETVELKVFDAFGGYPLSATVHAQNLESIIDVHGIAPVKIAQQNKVSLVQVVPQDEAYVAFKSIHTDTLDYWHLPLIRADWLHDIRNYARLNQFPETGMVIGFVEDYDFEAFLPHEAQFSLQNVIYFDQQGKVSQKGQAGGGFIIFNVPTGVQSITLLTSENKLSSRVIPVDAQSISVLKYNF